MTFQQQPSSSPVGGLGLQDSSSGHLLGACPSLSSHHSSTGPRCLHITAQGSCSAVLAHPIPKPRRTREPIRYLPILHILFPPAPPLTPSLQHSSSLLLRLSLMLPLPAPPGAEPPPGCCLPAFRPLRSPGSPQCLPPVAVLSTHHTRGAFAFLFSPET